MAAPLPAQFAWSDHRPAPANALAACLDEVRGCFVVLATNPDTSEFETWEAGNSWTRRPLAVSPPARSASCMVYDPVHRRMVLFGGDQSQGSGTFAWLADTWEYDGQRWRQRHPTTSPPARGFAAMAWDLARQEGVLFGGLGYLDTWTWDGDTWTQRNVPGPPALYLPSMAFDSRRGRIVLFGSASAARGPT